MPGWFNLFTRVVSYARKILILSTIVGQRCFALSYGVLENIFCLLFKRASVMQNRTHV
jgi:hypothetical protein